MTHVQELSHQAKNLRSYPATGTQRFSHGAKAPSSTSDRLIIDFVTYECCMWNTPHVMTDDAVTRTPEAVVKAGVSPDDWQRHMNLIREAALGHTVSYCSQILCLISHCFCCLAYAIKKTNEAVRLAVDAFNTEVLEKHGLYAKTQKVVYGCNYTASTHDVAWLVVALTPAEAQVLREEPHLYSYDGEKALLTPVPDGLFCTFTECCGTKVVV